MTGHNEPLAECMQIFKRIEEKIDARAKHTDEKLDGLIQRADRINGRYEKHIEESTKYRKEVDRHEHLFESLAKASEEKLNTTKASQWRIGLIVATGMSLLLIIAQLFIHLRTG